MVAIGVGGADAVDVMTGFPFNVRWPKLIGVHLTGTLSGWSSPKDIILKVAEILTVKGGTGAIIEYFGPGADSITATGKATVCNMGAEIGATTSLFAYDANMADYLRATGRAAIADAADAVAADLRADDDVLADPGAVFDQVIEIDLDQLGPMINGPHSPDRAHQLAEVGDAARAEGWPLEISLGAHRLVHQQLLRGHHPRRVDRPPGVGQGPAREDPAAHHPGLRADPRHHRARRPPRRPRGDRRHGAGQRLRPVHRPVGPHRPRHLEAEHDREQLQPQLPEAQRRQRQHAQLRHEPRHGHRAGARRHARLRPAHRHAHQRRRRAGAARPAQRARPSPTPASTPARTPSRRRPPTAAAWRSSSTRRATGSSSSSRSSRGTATTTSGCRSCSRPRASAPPTTSPRPGPWLKYRGHLENISGNLYLGAVNAYTGEAGTGKDPIDGETRPFPEIAKRLHEAGIGWVAIGDENMGEGSSREHAAMEPRFRNAKVILARSFARIHETNLKKQGLLPLTFADPATYDQIGEDDTISVHGLADLAPDTPGAVHDQQARRHHRRVPGQPHLQRRADRVVPAPAAPSTSSARSTADGRPSGSAFGHRRSLSPAARSSVCRPPRLVGVLDLAAGVGLGSSSAVGVRFLRASAGSSALIAFMIFLVSASGTRR